MSLEKLNSTLTTDEQRLLASKPLAWLLQRAGAFYEQTNAPTAIVSSTSTMKGSKAPKAFWNVTAVVPHKEDGRIMQKLSFRAYTGLPEDNWPELIKMLRQYTQYYAEFKKKDVKQIPTKHMTEIEELSKRSTWKPDCEPDCDLNNKRREK